MQFSILTPSFNQASFLERNLASVRDQDVTGTQHIVIDGGSSDGTREILSQHGDYLHYWCSEPDAGQADALNKALSHATGDIIGWLNVDEYYEPKVFRLVEEAFRRNPRAAVVYGDFRRVEPDGTPIRVNRTWRFDYEVCRIQTPIIMNCSAFFRRDRLVEVGGFDASWQYIMDWELYIRFMRGGQRWVRLPHVLANFTMHPASKTASSQDKFNAEIGRLRAREYPDLNDQQFAAAKQRQFRRMQWHMFQDGVLLGKIWFKLVTQRRYSEYFGSDGSRLPVISHIIDVFAPRSPKR